WVTEATAAVGFEGVVSVVDILPLAFEQRARAEPMVKNKLEVAPSSFLETLGRDLWDELKQLIRVDRIDQSDPALLAPNQVFFLRENLKLRLINARLALLQRDSKTYREELRQARIWLERYFDVREKPVVNAVSTLKALSSADLSLELPTLGETLGSIRNFKLAKK
ncbi:MAG TPA: uroporphyrinogen-III C-methyltransferase, partial [Rhodocyclaceae bacterium]|nr:uroporphyrinogen-III C-methyltransferase [Rhodocyclaceae bacterium]